MPDELILLLDKRDALNLDIDEVRSQVDEVALTFRDAVPSLYTVARFQDLASRRLAVLAQIAQLDELLVLAFLQLHKTGSAGGEPG